MAFIELRHSFDKTNFDLEDSSPSGGPINASNNGHQQIYTPQNKFIESEQGSRTGGKLYPTSDPTIATFTNAFNGNLDLENNDPTSVGISGGGKEGFTPKYTPKSGQGYEDSPQGKLKSPDSAAEKNNFKTSALDLESSEAGIKQGGKGGPNRILDQSKNTFQSGQYTVKRAGGLGIGNIAGMNGQGGEVIKQTLHTYTPQNPYFEAGGLDLTPIGSPQNVNSVPFTPKNNTVENNGEKGYDATLK